MNPELSREQRNYHLSVCPELPTHLADSSDDLEPILYRDSRGRLVLEARLWSHTAGQISEAIVAFVSPENSRPELRHLQSKFVTLFQDTLKRYEHNRAPLRYSVSKFFDIFNSLFFGDMLKHCQIKTVKRNIDNKDIDGECVSQECPERLGVKRIIQIVIVQTTIGPTPSEQLSCYLGVLIHEMLHASFVLFACHCSESCTRPYYSSDGTGLTGHGIAWQNAAAAILSFIKRNPSFRSRIKGMNVDLSLAHEIKTSGLFKDYLPYMKDWSFNPQEIRDMVIDIE